MSSRFDRRRAADPLEPAGDFIDSAAVDRLERGRGGLAALAGLATDVGGLALLAFRNPSDFTLDATATATSGWRRSR
jgi:hypothetical protein